MNCCGMDQATLRALGAEIEGFTSVSYWAEGRDSDVVREFNAAYGDKFEGKIPSANVAGGYMTASLVAKVLEEKGLVTGEDLVSAITEFTFDDSIFGRVSFDDYNNTVGPVYIREVQEVDGQLMNVPIKTYEDVDQWLGQDPAEVLEQQPYSQSNQG
jgi:branched-chain amino acid transport system substrate-binding protein